MRQLIVKDIRQLLSNRVLVGFCLLVLLMSWAMINIGFKDEEKSEEKIVVGIVNEDYDNKYSKMIVDFFGLDDSFSSMVDMAFCDTQEEMRKKFLKDEVQAYIVIPDGFVEDLINISDSRIKVRINQKDSTTAIILGNVLRSYETYVCAVQCNSGGLYDAMRESDIPRAECILKNVTVSYDLITKVLNKGGYFDYEVVEDYSTVSIVEYYIYAAMIIFIMYASLYIGIEILKEKGYGVLDRYKACGGSCIKFILSKIICAVTMIYSMTAMAYIMSSKMKKQDINNEILIFFLLVIIFCVMFSICSSFIIRNLHTYVLTVNMICVLSIMLGGAIIPTMYLPDNIKSIAKYIPTYTFMEVLTTLNNGQTLKSYSDKTGIIILLSVVMLTVSSILYRRSVLND